MKTSELARVFASTESPPSYASCLHCGALIFVSEVRLSGRASVIQWNPSLSDLDQMLGAIGGDCLHRQKIALPLADFHDCDDGMAS